MSTPHFYCWDDAGSPGRNLSGNTQNRLKQILVPCLVTGYGDKPGAGWTIGHEHPNGFSLINADGNVVNFVSDLPAQTPYPAMRSSAIHVYTAESLLDTSGAIIGGTNLCSGVFRKGYPEPASYKRHSLGNPGGVLRSTLSSSQWVLVADSATFVFSHSARGSVDDYASTPISLYCGKSILDSELSGNFVALGGDILAYDDYNPSYAYCRGYSSPTNLATGLAETVAVGAEPYMSSHATNPSGQYALALARINFQQPRLRFGNSFLGRLRGVVYDDVLRSCCGWEDHLKALGFTGTDFTDRGKTVLIDGHRYAFARSHSGNSFLTDNPAFW